MTRVLIVGGGIAGPVTALALRQAGIESVLYEAHSGEAGDAGAFLTVAVNGLDALRAVDAHTGVLAAAFPTRSIELRSGTGKRLGVVPIGGDLPDGTVTQTLKRADLHRALDSAARARGIRIERNKRLVDATLSADGGVVAQFDDGTRAAGDLLIGADGIHSRTRRIIDPAAPAPRHTGLGNIGGFTRVPGVATGDAGSYIMIFGKRAFFGYTVSPSGEVWWFANPPSDRELTRAELASMTSEDWQARLIPLFAGDAGPAVEIIRSTTAIAATNQHDMPKVPTWSRGPMVIIGDAAHAASPTSGQGASMAMEDGVVLAQCLRDLPDAERAFAAYEAIRRPRVERIVAWAARMNNSKAPGPVARVLRDLVLPMILKRQEGIDSQRWIFDHHIEWEAQVRLPKAA